MATGISRGYHSDDVQHVLHSLLADYATAEDSTDDEPWSENIWED